MFYGVRLLLCVALVAGPLASCAPGQGGGAAFSTQKARLGPDDGRDSCRQYEVALDSTGNYFAADILAGAATGALGGGLIGGLTGGDWKGALIGAGIGAATGAAAGYWNALQKQNYDQAVLYSRVQGDIGNDNAQIMRTQAAFDQLMGCRFAKAAGINASLAAHAIDRPTAEAQMANVRGWAQRDVTMARGIDRQVEQRGQQFSVAADNLAPGTSARIAAEDAPVSDAAVVVRSTKLRLSPNEGAPGVASLPANAKVKIQRQRGAYALVQADTGQTGYAPTEDLGTEGHAHHKKRSIAPGAPAEAESVKPAASQDVATLAGSNAARRDDFAQSVAVSDKAVASGFELAS